jgi:hypothetical protein
MQMQMQMQMQMSSRENYGLYQSCSDDHQHQPAPSHAFLPTVRKRTVLSSRKSASSTNPAMVFFSNYASRKRRKLNKQETPCTYMHELGNLESQTPRGSIIIPCCTTITTNTTNTTISIQYSRTRGAVFPKIVIANRQSQSIGDTEYGRSTHNNNRGIL